MLIDRALILANAIILLIQIIRKKRKNRRGGTTSGRTSPSVYFRYRLLVKHTKFGVIFYPEY